MEFRKQNIDKNAENSLIFIKSVGNPCLNLYGQSLIIFRGYLMSYKLQSAHTHRSCDPWTWITGLHREAAKKATKRGGGMQGH